MNDGLLVTLDHGFEYLLIPREVTYANQHQESPSLEMTTFRPGAMSNIHSSARSWPLFNDARPARYTATACWGAARIRTAPLLSTDARSDAAAKSLADIRRVQGRPLLACIQPARKPQSLVRIVLLSGATCSAHYHVCRHLRPPCLHLLLNQSLDPIITLNLTLPSFCIVPHRSVRTLGRLAAAAHAAAPVTGAAAASTIRCVQTASHRSTWEKVSAATAAAACTRVADMQHTNGCRAALRHQIAHRHRPQPTVRPRLAMTSMRNMAEVKTRHTYGHRHIVPWLSKTRKHP